MIATLMIERMPLATTDKLSRCVHLLSSLCQRISLGQHRFLTPAAAGTVQVVMRIPVIHILTKLSGKDTLADAAHIHIRPSVNHIIILLDTCRIPVGNSHWTVWIRILILGQLQRLQGEILRIAGLIQDRLPHQNRRMVAVTTYDFTGILEHTFCKQRVLVPILPARCSHDDEDTEFIAGIHERRVLRIVGSTDDVETCILQTEHISPLLTVGKCIAHISKILMTVGTDKLAVFLAVEPETFLATELKAADTQLGLSAVQYLLTVLDAGNHTI